MPLRVAQLDFLLYAQKRVWRSGSRKPCVVSRRPNGVAPSRKGCLGRCSAMPLSSTRAQRCRRVDFDVS